jgi:hypothetical protein
MKISIDVEFIKQLLSLEDFYNKVPEYFFLKEAGSQIVEAMSRDGGCTACTENNLIKPTVAAFMSHTVNMYLDCGKEALDKFKLFVKSFKNIEEDFQISVLYTEFEGAEITELLI